LVLLLLQLWRTGWRRGNCRILKVVFEITVLEIIKIVVFGAFLEIIKVVVTGFIGTTRGGS
jgi:hypothetical protein